MTPITEDQIVSLMRGLERREKSGLPTSLKSREKASGTPLTRTSAVRRRLNLLEDFVPARAARRTVSGLFVYSPRRSGSDAPA